MRNTTVTGICLPPALLAEAAAEPSLLPLLQRLRVINTGGAPLSHSTGSLLSKSGNLQLIIGSSEGGWWPTLNADPSDWEYHHFHPALSSSFEHTVDDMYEMVIHKTASTLRTTNFFWACPEGGDEFRTKDLWTPHPVKEGLWRYRCRTDDLVLLTGEIKFYASSLEEKVAEHEAVKCAIVGGQQRERPFLLLELQPWVDGSCEGKKETWDDVWRAIDEMNSRNEEHTWLKRERCVVAKAGKPVVRLDKGTVDKRRTLQLYEEEIDALYGGPAA